MSRSFLVVLAFFSFVFFLDLPLARAAADCQVDLNITVTNSTGGACDCVGTTVDVSSCTLQEALQRTTRMTSGHTNTITLDFDGAYSSLESFTFSGVNSASSDNVSLVLQAASGKSPILEGATLTSRILSITDTFSGSHELHVMLDGITFQNADTYGGVVITLGDNSSTVTVNNCTFENNTDDTTASSDLGGGGLFIDAINSTVNVSLLGNHFISNTVVGGSGGGMHVLTKGAVVIGGMQDSEQNTIQSNHTPQGSGAGALLHVGALTMLNNIFTDNHADSGDSSSGGIAGGVLADVGEGGSGNTDIENNIIDGNTALADSGGGIYLQLTVPDYTFKFSANQVSNNEDGGFSHLGGGVLINLKELSNGAAVVSDNLVYGNMAAFGGGGIFFQINAALTLDIVNNTITRNSANNLGGGIAFILSGPFSSGATFNLYNNIIYNNEASSSQEVLFGNISGGVFTANIFNNDVAFAQTCSTTDITTFTCNLPTAENGNLDNVDPLFTAPDSDDFTLQSTSPVIGKGDASAPGIPTTDYAGNTMNNPPDLGALQYVVSQLSINLDSHNFGVFTGGTLSQVFVLTNTGSQDSTINDISLSNDTDFSLDFGVVTTSNKRFASTIQACGSASFSLAAGQSCSFAVNFNPQNFGAISGNLVVNYNSASTITVPLSGFAGGVGGGGCALRSEASPHLGFWMALFALLPLILRRVQYRKN